MYIHLAVHSFDEPFHCWKRVEVISLVTLGVDSSRLDSIFLPRKIVMPTSISSLLMLRTSSEASFEYFVILSFAPSFKICYLHSELALLCRTNPLSHPIFFWYTRGNGLCRQKDEFWWTRRIDHCIVSRRWLPVALLPPDRLLFQSLRGKSNSTDRFLDVDPAGCENKDHYTSVNHLIG